MVFSGKKVTWGSRNIHGLVISSLFRDHFNEKNQNTDIYIIINRNKSSKSDCLRYLMYVGLFE